jgi:hypothetical protein
MWTIPFISLDDGGRVFSIMRVDYVSRTLRPPEECCDIMTPDRCHLSLNCKSSFSSCYSDRDGPSLFRRALAFVT